VTGRGNRAQRDRGQAAVEFAIALPVVVVLVLGIVQLIVVVRDQLAVELAARQAARAASMSASPGADADRAANAAATGLRPLAVATHVTGDRVTVSVEYTSATEVPLIGAFIADVTVSARVTMSREPPPAP
jgi:Flp pilus assembly protein TadG